MLDATNDKLCSIVDFLCRSDKFSMELNQAKVHREIARNEVAQQSKQVEKCIDCGATEDLEHTIYCITCDPRNY